MSSTSRFVLFEKSNEREQIFFLLNKIVVVLLAVTRTIRICAKRVTHANTIRPTQKEAKRTVKVMEVCEKIFLRLKPPTTQLYIKTCVCSHFKTNFYIPQLNRERNVDSIQSFKKMTQRCLNETSIDTISNRSY
ncbi:MAG: hypothetical protein ACI90V_003095 [Bacillariaceae sp.]|jgi:hypothetical protein